ncbi:hypothetical protein, partial [Halalkalibacter flavus]|uniref:hypothetical protein n=1 Tax=Halalkalibacter flavus TaxID=3090668 RepID=UPI002FC96E22
LTIILSILYYIHLNNRINSYKKRLLRRLSQQPETIQWIVFFYMHKHNAQGAEELWSGGATSSSNKPMVTT